MQRLKFLGSCVPGLVLGLVVGKLVLSPVVLDAAAKFVGVKVHATAENTCTWDQPAADLASASGIRVRVTCDTSTAADTATTCSGAASPFQCRFTVPMANQAIGQHTLTVNGANVDPIDGTLSDFTMLFSVQYEVIPPLAPPLPGQNPRIIRIIGSLPGKLVSFIARLGHL